MPNFTLADDGDAHEQEAWPLFVRDEFPQYEEFWQVFVVGLTGRVIDPREIRFLSDDDITERGCEPRHVVVAQLHYTTLLHLLRVFHLRKRRVHDRDSFFEAMVRLDAATDTACELLGRCILDRCASEAWDEVVGQQIRQKWLDYDEDGRNRLKTLSGYRNALLHGRIRPEYEVTFETGHGRTTVPFYPTFEKVRQKETLDWRKADLADFAPADHLVDEAWLLVLDYLCRAWDEQLLPWTASEKLREPERPNGSDDSSPIAGVSPAPSHSDHAAPAYSGGSAIMPPSGTSNRAVKTSGHDADVSIVSASTTSSRTVTRFLRALQLGPDTGSADGLTE